MQQRDENIKKVISLMAVGYNVESAVIMVFFLPAFFGEGSLKAATAFLDIFAKQYPNAYNQLVADIGKAWLVHQQQTKRGTRR